MDALRRHSRRYGSVVRNVSIYLLGVGLAIGGAVGIIDIIVMPVIAAWFAFVVGLLLVLVVHERFGGPWPPVGDV